MGRFFERVLLQDKGMAGLMTMISGITKAAAAIGYKPSEEGVGVPIRFTEHPDSEWFDFESPLLEAASETAEPFMLALAKEGRVQVLWLNCVDSDFVACRLIDATNGTDTVACIGTPYEPLGEPDYDAWAASCKKKWKCKPAQLRSVFEGEYTFAEDGIESLAALLHFAPAILPEENSEPADRTFWFVPEAKINETTRPHTLAEKIADFIEREYAAKLEAAGYRRYKNSPVRWHKVVGVPGNEVLLSMVFSVYRGFEIAPIYGAQSLYCPLELSDKYYPLHDASEYWREARAVFDRRAYLAAVRNQQAEVRLPYRDEEALPVLIDGLMLPELAKVTDLSSCRAYYLAQEGVLHENAPATRLWIEAAQDGDGEAAKRWYGKQKARADWWVVQRAENGAWNKDTRRAMLDAFETGGSDALLACLRETVYRDNLKKLKRAGIL